MPSPVILATAAVPLLRQAIHAIEARADWTPEQKRWIPWVCVALGTLAAVACAVAGMPYADAAIVGSTGPGAVVLNELLGVTKKPPVPPAALPVIALFLSGCASEVTTAAAVALATGAVAACTMLAALALASIVRAAWKRRLADASDTIYIEAPTLTPLSDADAASIARAIANKRRRSGAMVCAVALLSLSGCARLTPKAAGYIAARVTGQSLDLAAESYATAYDAKADALHDEAIAACKGSGRAAFRPCVEGKMEPWSRAEKAISVYRGLRKAGASVLDHQYIAAVADAIAALAAVGIKVTP